MHYMFCIMYSFISSMYFDGKAKYKEKDYKVLALTHTPKESYLVKMVDSFDIVRLDNGLIGFKYRYM